MKKENLLKILFFVALVGVAVYFTYPKELSEAQKMAYITSYGTTLSLTVGGIAIGVVLGFIIAFVRFLNIRPINFVIDEYIDIIRGTPVLIQLMVFAFIVFATMSNSLYAAIIALGLNSSAYVAEIVRSGINSVDKGQMEAARAMGLTYSQSMKEVVFPQAIKNIVPALANEFISLFKETSVVGMIGIFDLTMFSQSLQATLFTAKPILFAAVIYYVSVKFFSLLVKILESRLNRND
ncbi:MAG: amino acid ABC transporter permease [Campylobacteraceae bacterium]|nr:amino acid ABC transporter permease [Campylobacteraceae bacterium]